ncbi:zinc ribbon domain-containing protein [Streptomyces sp. BH055]|uniref:zinc ribbon domain-containing protein n=1 Tax=Streptomyces sp. BH055 TaxID=3401173 RepID=UPI003BB64FAD
MPSSNCPHCGAASPDEARFCMSCGQERRPAAQAGPVPPRPPAPPTVPPPPAHPPEPAGPSAVGAFFGRALRGDWPGAAQAALWPVGLLLVGAVGLAIPSYGQNADDGDFVGFGDRMRIALAVLMHGLGGSFEVRSRSRGSSIDAVSGSASGSIGGSISVSMPPLLVAVLWSVALLIGVRMLRTRMLDTHAATAAWAPRPDRTLGLEVAVRVGLLAMAGTVVLALFGQPEIQQVEFVSAPFMVALCTLALGVIVTVGVFQRADIAEWLTVRPGVALASRAFGSAVRATAWVLPLALVAAFVVGAVAGNGDGFDSSDTDDASDAGGTAGGIVLLLLCLPNVAVTALGFLWGAPLQAQARGSGLAGGGTYEKESFGWGQLGDKAGTGAVVGVAAAGLLLALLVGCVIARRSRERREMFLGGGFFYVLLLILAAVGGLAAEGSGGLAGDVLADGRVEAGLGMPELLLFGLLWVGCGVLAAPYLLRLMALDAGRRAPVDRRGVGVWVGTVVGAFVIGGGAAAGVLLLQDAGNGKGDGGSSAKDDKPVAAASTAGPSASPSPSASASDPSSAPASTAASVPATVPAGYHRVTDSLGFTFAVPDAWSRQGVENGSQVTYAGSTGLAHYLVGVIPNADYTSYGNLLNMEKHAQADKDKANYQRVRLERNTFKGRPGARWEYTYENGAGQTLHCVDQSYIGADGTEYAILLTVNDDVWAESEEIYRVGLDTWRLTDTD